MRFGLFMFLAAPVLPRLPALTPEERTSLVEPLAQSYQQRHPNAVFVPLAVMVPAFLLLQVFVLGRTPPWGTSFASMLGAQFAGIWTQALLVGRRIRPDVRAALWAAGRCVYCGYDLRATPGQCPECGRATGPGA